MSVKDDRLMSDHPRPSHRTRKAGPPATLINSFENTTYTYAYDAAARLTQLQSSFSDTNHPGTLFAVTTYNPLSQIQKATLGNGVVRNVAYDNRGRGTSLTDGSLYNFSLTYAPDSNILTGNDQINGNWTYTYDDFSRVATSSKTGQAVSYNYDASGNRWQQNVTTGQGPAPQYTFDANNHITTSGISYDAAGNVSNDTFRSYNYDAENRLLTVDGTTASYYYDVYNHRVSERFSGGSSKDYIFNLAGKEITEVDNLTSWSRSELYAGGMHVATYSNGTTYFDHHDWVGTVRGRSLPNATLPEKCTSLAFGDAQSCGNGNSAIAFTGAWWDGESNLTHFPFRQLSTTQGRWITPDPAGLNAVDPTNPQSWNRYAYAINIPLKIVDPLGLEDDSSGSSNIAPVLGDDGAWTFSVTVLMCPGPGCGITLPDPPVFLPSTMGMTLDPAANNGNCGTSSLPRSFGVSYGGNADAGAGYEGISATGSAGAGVFYNGNTGASTGAFAGGGATAYFFNGNIGAPKQQGQPFNFGGYAGGGPSVWVSNAGGAPQLGGPFTTLSLNVGAGLVKGSLQLSYGGGIWQLSIGPPIPYVSVGTPSISVSKITTKTTTTSGCH